MFSGFFIFHDFYTLYSAMENSAIGKLWACKQISHYCNCYVIGEEQKKLCVPILTLYWPFKTEAPGEFH